LYSNCHNVNPNASAVGGIYGYSHTCGGQAEFVRVPFADVGPSKIPEWMEEEDAVLLTDACPTGYFGAQLGEIKEGDVVVAFGAGPVGLFAAKSAWLMGAGRVIVVPASSRDTGAGPSRKWRHTSPERSPRSDVQSQECPSPPHAPGRVLGRPSLAFITSTY
jgi:D-arabinose 1-dehydrogenase-like Zn-dependent alcohol dehydrogenase